MARIRIDFEQLHFVAQKFWRATDQLNQLRSRVRSAYHVLEIEQMEFKSRAHIYTEVQQAERICKTLENTSRSLARKLEQISLAFESAERENLAGISSISSVFPGLITAGLLPISISGALTIWDLGQETRDGFSDALSWISTGENLSTIDKILSLTHKFLGEMSKAEYLAFGRYINSDWAHNVRGGWVGKMGTAEQIIKSDALKYGLLTPLGVVISWYNDPDLDRVRAGQTAVTEEIIKVGIASTGAGAVVLTANTAFQLYGGLTAYHIENTGRLYGEGWEEIFDQQSYSLEDNFDRVDLGNITHDLTHIIVDSYPLAKYFAPGGAMKLSNTATGIITGQTTWSNEWSEISFALENIEQDVLNLGQHVSDVPGGLLDIFVDLSTNKMLEYVAALDNNPQIPPEWADSLHNAALEFGQTFVDFDQTWENDIVSLFAYQ